jgi:acyloxyacyl hydrolase
MTYEQFEQHIIATKQKYDFSKVEKVQMCEALPMFCGGWEAIADHKPYFDDDGDLFSNYGGLRGHDWRGKDCDDKNPNIFPGRLDPDIGADNNCNGIFGVDPNTGIPYETQWCDGTGSMGIAILGDSATAHFRIPPTYFEPKEMSLSTFKNLVRIAENELDFPSLSWSTGHDSTSNWANDISGPVDSIYMHLRELNLCNNNDY